jgi:hypothetical protein
MTSAVRWGTETFLAHDLVPEDLPASSKGPAEQQIRHIGGIRYLIVDQTANRRQGSKISKDLAIWDGTARLGYHKSRYSPLLQHLANASEPLAV